MDSKSAKCGVRVRIPKTAQEICLPFPSAAAGLMAAIGCSVNGLHAARLVELVRSLGKCLAVGSARMRCHPPRSLVWAPRAARGPLQPGAIVATTAGLAFVHARLPVRLQVFAKASGQMRWFHASPTPAATGTSRPGLHVVLLVRPARDKSSVLLVRMRTARQRLLRSRHKHAMTPPAKK